MKREFLGALLVASALSAPAPADQFRYTVLDSTQMIGAGRIEETGSFTRGPITISADAPTSTTDIRGYGGWALPTTAVRIKEAWVIAKVLPFGKSLPNPVGIPLQVHFIQGAFDAARPQNSVAEYQRLASGPLISLPPARREHGSLLAIPFSAEALIWLEGQRFSGMKELNLGFTEQPGQEIHVRLDSPYLLLNPPHVSGDANGDGVLNSLDIAPFARSVLGDAAGYESLTDLPLYFHDLDVNYSGAVDNLDIQPFVEMLTAASAPTPEPEAVVLALIGVVGALWARRRNALKSSIRRD